MVLVNTLKELLQMENKMQNRNSYTPNTDQVRVIQPRNAKEKQLLNLLKYHGFHNAAAGLDAWKERIDLDVAIASWTNYPRCMDEYPTIITKKVKIDPKDLL